MSCSKASREGRRCFHLPEGWEGEEKLSSGGCPHQLLSYLSSSGLTSGCHHHHSSLPQTHQIWFSGSLCHHSHLPFPALSCLSSQAASEGMALCVAAGDTAGQGNVRDGSSEELEAAPGCPSRNRRLCPRLGASLLFSSQSCPAPREGLMAEQGKGSWRHQDGLTGRPRAHGWVCPVKDQTAPVTKG